MLQPSLVSFELGHWGGGWGVCVCVCVCTGSFFSCGGFFSTILDREDTQSRPCDNAIGHWRRAGGHKFIVWARLGSSSIYTLAIPPAALDCLLFLCCFWQNFATAGHCWTTQLVHVIAHTCPTGSRLTPLPPLQKRHHHHCLPHVHTWCITTRWQWRTTRTQLFSRSLTRSYLILILCVLLVLVKSVSTS